MTALDEARAALQSRQGRGARYDAEAAPARELAWVRLGTAYFARKLNELSDQALLEPSALPGLDRASIVAAVSYRARALALIAEQARTGEPVSDEAESFVPSDPAALAQEIALAATLPARALRNLFQHSEIHLNVEWRDLDSAAWDRSAPGPDGQWPTPRACVGFRARDIWLAAIDLGNGGRFADLPADLLDAILKEGRQSVLPCDIALRPDDRPRGVATEDRRPAATGRAADLARWLTGRGVQEASLPPAAPKLLPLMHMEHPMTRSECLFPSPEWPALQVRGERATYPVHRIFCVGRNYAAHAAEMGTEVDREAPFYFTKSALALIHSGGTIPYPPGTENFHYEMELVIAIGAPAFKAHKAAAAAAIYGYACGLDMTRRDLQLTARAKQRPWDLGKDFEQSAVIAPITQAVDFAPIGPQRIHLEVNGAVRQDAHLNDLIWKLDELVSHLSLYYHLAPGDLIMTGTPAGVGSVVAGDVVTGGIDGLDPVQLTIGAAE